VAKTKERWRPIICLADSGGCSTGQRSRYRR
jgi:hypothetical protein